MESLGFATALIRGLYSIANGPNRFRAVAVLARRARGLFPT